MTTEKKTAVWMDHSHANIIAFPHEAILKTITSGFTHQDKKETLQRSESAMHNKQQQKEAAYYHEIATAIKECVEVLLFGPTDAKKELFNLLRDNRHFDTVTISLEDTGKMTDAQQFAFVDNHFSGHGLKES